MRRWLRACAVAATMVACGGQRSGAPRMMVADDGGLAAPMTRGRDVLTPAPDTPPAAPLDAGTAVAPLSDALQRALPTLGEAELTRLRVIRAAGAARGMREGVFAKIGDSITESGSYLFDVGEGWYELGAFAALEPTIQHFRAQPLGDRNSFNRASACATAGWTASSALEGDPSSPLRAELSATRPGYAVVMYGTNDIDRDTPDGLQRNLTRILEIIEENGTVPILSTIPDRTDRAAAAPLAIAMNERIRALAVARHIPLMDYWAALQPLPARGLDGDGIHPNVYRGDAGGNFTAEGLRFGYNMRNLVTLLSLDRLRAAR
jgi:hypothetical protein